MKNQVIELASEGSLEEVLPFIEQYQEFYQAKDMSASRNREFFHSSMKTNPLIASLPSASQTKLLALPPSISLSHQQSQQRWQSSTISILALIIVVRVLLANSLNTAATLRLEMAW